MKLKLLALCLTMGLFAFGTGANAQDASEPGGKGAAAPNIDFTPIINAILAKIDDNDAQAKLCKKGVLPNITLRSLGGAGCQYVNFVGALAAVLCAGYTDADGPYEKSTCAQNNPFKTAEAGSTGLQANLKPGTNSYKVFCSGHTFTTPNLKKIAAACPKTKETKRGTTPSGW